MFKRILVMWSVLVCLVFSPVLADVSSELEQAKAYVSALVEQPAYEAEGDYEQTEEIYRLIVTNYPGTDEALQAQKNLAVLFITTDNYSAAQAEVDALIADFTGHQDLPQVVYDLANSWWFAAKPEKEESKKLFKYEESKKLFKYIVDNMPDSDLAIWAQAWVAGCDRKMGNYTAAQEQIDALIKDFADNPQLTGVIYTIADFYWNTGRYEDSGRFYQYVLERDPNGDLAVWAKGWITGLELILGDSVSAQQVIDAIVKDCAGQSQLVLGRILYGNANGCWHVRKYEQARELYKYIVDNLPESGQSMLAKVWGADCDIKMGNYAAAEEGINALVEGFDGDPNLAEQVLQAAEPYYDEALRKEAEGLNSQARDYFQKALAIYEMVKNRVPGYVPTADTLYWTGVCYRGLGEYTKSIECCQKVADDWPGYKYAWQALFLVGCNYEELQQSEAISESEAIPLIKAAYEQLLEKYPDCPSANTAQNWLAHYNSIQEMETVK